MANQQDNTGLTETENAVDFINETVLQPEVKPIIGTATPMIEQAVGMMVQDLQIFLKGFEQISLVALAKLANNILTYGYYYPIDEVPKPNGLEAESIQQDTSSETGQKVMKDLFSLVGDYGKQKAQVNALLSAINSGDTSASFDTDVLKDSDEEDQQSTPEPKEEEKGKSWFSRKK